MRKYAFLVAFVMALGLVSACGGEEATTEETGIEEVAEEEAGIKADDAYTWLKESGLVTGEAEDVTSEFEGSEGLVKAIRTPEAEIVQYETIEQAKKYEKPDSTITIVVDNIYILLKANRDKAEHFVTVLEKKAPLSEEEMAAVKDHPFADSMNADFNEYVTAFYNIPKEERSPVYDTYVHKKEVTWTGTVADTEAMGDSVVLVSSDDYKGQDWATISTDNKELMPYTIVVELKDESSKEDIKNGDKVKVKGVVGARGDEGMQVNWKLYEGVIVD
ncbi:MULTISPECIES: hypothetical protein [unclassified Exiguobacterium]|uniref:hypothetical protein n=1 Tax=unclassified Exiguobacterium TaxID=2644629 RepID=UPI00135B47FE|nr:MULTISPECIES: hypothetical protein [unclassified Exiguobacterium]